jgi:hypothetical protein
MVDNTSSTCSSTSSHRSDEQIYKTSSTLPLLYFNPYTHLFQSNEHSCSTSINDNENLKLKDPNNSRSCSR